MWIMPGRAIRRSARAKTPAASDYRHLAAKDNSGTFRAVLSDGGSRRDPGGRVSFRGLV